MTEKFPILMKDRNPSIQETQHTPNMINIKKDISGHITEIC